MGSSQAKSENLDPTLDAQLYDQSENCKFFRNSSGQQFEKYQVIHNNQADFQNRYQFRIKNPSPYLVNAYHAEPVENSFGCTSQTQFSVVTQRIKERLSTLHNLSFEQSLNFVDKSLRGYQQLFKSNGIILVKDDMIGISWENQVKVWLSGNFYQNHSQEQPLSYKMLMEEDKESIMVDNIIELINSRASREVAWREFMDEKYSKGRLNFKMGIELVERFCESKSIKLDKKIYNIEAKRQTQILSQPNSVKRQETGQSFSRINSTDSHNLSKRSSAIVFNHLDKSKSNSLQISKNLHEPSPSQKKSIAIHYGQPQKVSNSMKLQKTSNLASIRQKIVNGPNYTPVIASSSNLPEVNYRQNTLYESPYSKVVSEKKDLSPTPHTLHRFTLNANVHQSNKMDKNTSPEPYTYNQSPIQNKIISNKVVSYPSSVVNFQNMNPQFQGQNVENGKLATGNIANFGQQNVVKKKKIVENPFDLIEKNKIIQVVSANRDHYEVEKVDQNKEPSEESKEITSKEEDKAKQQKIENLMKKEESLGKIEIEDKKQADEKVEIEQVKLEEKQEEENQYIQNQTIEYHIQKAEYDQAREEKPVDREKVEKENIKVEMRKQENTEKESNGMGKEKREWERLKSEKSLSRNGSKDLKGMISYKDLRNLLRSTKEYKYD